MNAIACVLEELDDFSPVVLKTWIIRASDKGVGKHCFGPVTNGASAFGAVKAFLGLSPIFFNINSLGDKFYSLVAKRFDLEYF